MASEPRVLNLRKEKIGNAVYVGRANRYLGLPASPFANPFKIGQHGDRDGVIAHYRLWIEANPTLAEQARLQLRGRDLACWCVPLACHATVLLEIANDNAKPQDRGGEEGDG